MSLVAATQSTEVTAAVRLSEPLTDSLGNTVNNSSNVFSKRHESRQKALMLRDKMRQTVDRTLVPRYNRDGFKTGMFPRHDRFLACGHRSILGDGRVEVTYDGTKAGYRGTMNCGSVWVCFVCAQKIQNRRADEIFSALSWAHRKEYTIAMITLTVAHSRENPLATTVDMETGEVTDGVWDAISSGWASATSGEWASESVEAFSNRLEKWHVQKELALMGEYMTPEGVTHKARMPRGGTTNTLPKRRVGDKEAFGVQHWLRAVETTDGENGWHVHVHAIFILEGSKFEATKNAFMLGDGLFTRWQRGLAKQGFTAVKSSGGLDVSVGQAAEKTLAEYLTRAKLAKNKDTEELITNSFYKGAKSVSQEAALGLYKKGRAKGRTPFQILEDLDLEALEAGDAQAKTDFARWREWIDGSKGRRALTWSSGFRQEIGLDEEEVSDEVIADEDLGDPSVISLSSSAWSHIRRNSWSLLDSVELYGPTIAVAQSLSQYEDCYLLMEAPQRSEEGS